LVLRVSLYCLIYKVQAARSQLDYSITLVTACQALFQISLKFGSHPGQNPLVANLVILSHPQALVKTFFRIFSAPAVRSASGPASRKCFANISNHLPLVNTFLQVFRIFFTHSLHPPHCFSFTPVLC
ncbi:MAG: hypothetical protein PUB51_08410, partial [Oscillospiraceae bacterium]|nr:hypothetical protein [Oscillospiraceae bacterium]